MTKNTAQLGARGEDAAVAHLEAEGYRILARNWRCGEGEADVVAERGGDVVIVEVKTRSGTAAGHPFEAITPGKAGRLRRIALAWAFAHPQGPSRMRVDVIGVLPDPAGPGFRVEHLEAAA